MKDNEKLKAEHKTIQSKTNGKNSRRTMRRNFRKLHLSHAPSIIPPCPAYLRLDSNCDLMVCCSGVN